MNPPSLSDLLRPVLNNQYSVKDLRDLVHYAYAVVLPLVRKKIAFGKLNPEILGMQETDIIYDCLAELFQRDSRGRVHRLMHYFEQHQATLASTSEGEFQRLFRVLLFSQTKQNIIRLYSEADPVLGKILRNVKEYAGDSPDFNLIDRFGESYLALAGDRLAHRTLMPLEELKVRFFSETPSSDSVPDLLRTLRAQMMEQDTYQRIVPLVPYCLLVKELYSARSEGSQILESNIDHSFDAAAITGALDEVVHELEKESIEKYVKSNKKTEQVVGQYLTAVRSILSASIFEDKKDATSYYDLLVRSMPSLNKDEYANEHRSILEYLAKIGKRRLKMKIGRLYSVD